MWFLGGCEWMREKLNCGKVFKMGERDMKTE